MSSSDARLSPADADDIEAAFEADAAAAKAGSESAPRKSRGRGNSAGNVAGESLPSAVSLVPARDDRAAHAVSKSPSKASKKGKKTGGEAGGEEGSPKKGASGKKAIADKEFVNDIRASLFEYQRLMKQKKGMGSELWHVPENSHEWDEKQKEHTVNWGDIFFDLNFVAVAFKTGQLLADTLQTHNFIGFFYFYCLFTTMYECWALKLQYATRFNSTDVLHKFVDIGEALIVAMAAAQLSETVAGLEDHHSYQLKAFCATKLLHQVFFIVRWGELAVFGSKKRAKTQGVIMMKELSLGCLPLIAAVVTAFLNYPAALVCGLLLLVSLSQVLVELYRTCTDQRYYIKERTVPIHVEYLVHRYGEWSMLLLGEGVFSLILVGLTTEPHARRLLGGAAPAEPAAGGAADPANAAALAGAESHGGEGIRYLSFIAAYLSLAALRILFYSSQPFKAQGHAIAQSQKRGFLWLQVQPMISALLVCTGVGLKKLVYYDTLVGVDPSYDQYAWFFCCSIGVLLIMIWGTSLLHSGWHAEFDELPLYLRTVKLTTYVLKFALSAFLILMPLFHVPGYAYALLAVGIIALQIAINDLYARLLEDQEVKHGKATEQEVIMGEHFRDHKKSKTPGAEGAVAAAAAAAAAAPAHAAQVNRGRPDRPVKEPKPTPEQPVAQDAGAKSGAQSAMATIMAKRRAKAAVDAEAAAVKKGDSLQKDLYKLFDKHGMEEMKRALNKVVESEGVGGEENMDQMRKQMTFLAKRLD
jgi:hypothetical protein